MASVAPAIAVYPLAVSHQLQAGAAEFVAHGPLAGGFIQNPALAADQGIPVIEELYVDPTGKPAVLQETATCAVIQPGGVYVITPGQTTPISVNAATKGHRFAGVIYQPPTPFPPTPQTGTFPPADITTLSRIIPSYLYQQYADDDDLQSFVAAYNELAQIYASWFAEGLLPVYTGLSGSLLDWVALGLYGFQRPALGSGRNHDLGPLNTYPYNSLALNRRQLVGPRNVQAVDDDVFKRIITWNFYKGDGRVFNARWLKRRVMRFLDGADGSAPNIDQTYIVSVAFGAGIISIKIASGSRSIVGGSLPNRFGFNQRNRPLNSLITSFSPGPTAPPLASVLQEALNAGVLEMPVQYEVSITI